MYHAEMTHLRIMTPNYESWSKDELIAFGGNKEKLEWELERMARRKFKFTVSMQRFSKFNKEAQENTKFFNVAVVQFYFPSRLKFICRPHFPIFCQFLPFSQLFIVRVFHCVHHVQYLGKLVYQT
ncbi:hypothetical protein EDD22DRAFT_882282 [Suillus occidentalis]|nr:hypothetical protein EDD22DRAFT_882282 [Suillus occidentalis]